MLKAPTTLFKANLHTAFLACIFLAGKRKIFLKYLKYVNFFANIDREPSFTLLRPLIFAARYCVLSGGIQQQEEEIKI